MIRSRPGEEEEEQIEAKMPMLNAEDLREETPNDPRSSVDTECESKAPTEAVYGTGASTRRAKGLDRWTDACMLVLPRPDAQRPPCMVDYYRSWKWKK